MPWIDCLFNPSMPLDKFVMYSQKKENMSLALRQNLIDVFELTLQRLEENDARSICLSFDYAIALKASETPEFQRLNISQFEEILSKGKNLIRNFEHLRERDGAFWFQLNAKGQGKRIAIVKQILRELKTA